MSVGKNDDILRINDTVKQTFVVSSARRDRWPPNTQIDVTISRVVC
jgi:hypothetical protein